MIDVETLLRRGVADQREAVQRFNAQGDELLAQLAAMAPGDPRAGEVIRAGFEILHQLSMIPNVFPNDLYAAHMALHRASLRLTGESKLPNWTPSP